MHYDDGAFWRPLFELDMVPLQVTKGCSHNICRFCDMFKQQFEISSIDDVEPDVREIAVRFDEVPRLFLSGGNALAAPYDYLVEVLGLIAERINPIRGVGCFARISDVARLGDNELSSLHELGLDDISIGAESGYDPALSYMRKGFTADDIIEQSARLDAAGIAYNFFYLAGMAGKDRCVDAAEASAAVFNRTWPKRIMVHTMTAFPGTPLWGDIQEGLFVVPDETEILQDMRTLVAGLDIRTYILGNHYANTVHVSGVLPAQRESMLAMFDEAIAGADEQALRYFRSSIKSI